MICENTGCHCQSEFGVVRDGHLVCSIYCTPETAGIGHLCRCGHPGCGSAEEFVPGFEFGALDAAFV